MTTDYVGSENTYDGSGFIQLLSFEQNETAALIQNLFDNLWIDRGTRVVFLDFTLYNANINLFCQVKLVYLFFKKVKQKIIKIKILKG